MSEKSQTRCGFVALIGAPNAGKSTLMNAMVGAKLSIVTHKVQTTRAIVRGIALTGESQLIFVDTPGIFQPKRRLDRAMVSTAWSGAYDADLVCVLLDAKSGIDEEAEAILAKAASVNHEKILVINKVDLVQREKLLAATMSEEEMRVHLSVDSLKFISLDGLYRALGEAQGRNNDCPQYCDACFSGEYPVAPSDMLDQGFEMKPKAAE